VCRSVWGQIACAAVALAVLTGCGDTRQMLGLDKQTPDEFKIINRAPLDEEQQSALCLYAQALADRPARLMLGEREFVGLGA